MKQKNKDHHPLQPPRVRRVFDQEPFPYLPQKQTRIRPGKQKPVKIRRIGIHQSWSDRLGTWAGHALGYFRLHPLAAVISSLSAVVLMMSLLLLPAIADRLGIWPAVSHQTQVGSPTDETVAVSSLPATETQWAAAEQEDPFGLSWKMPSREQVLPEDDLEQAILASERAAEIEAKVLLLAKLAQATETAAPTSPPTTKATTQATTTAAPTTTEAPLAEPVRAPSSNNRVIGYYGGWKYLEGYTPDDIDASKLTHILYAFAYIDSNMRIGMGSTKYDPSNFAELRALKAANPHLKTLISVGGWDWSGRFSDAALTDANRTVFADSVVDFLLKYGFDGVDLDWEYPVRGGQAGNIKRPEDKQNFTLLMKKIREKLDAQSAKDGKAYLLSFAGGGTAEYATDTELDKLGQVVDFAMIMTYDYHGIWDARTDFNSPLYSVPHSPRYQINYNIHDTVNNWLNRGMPADKLVIGVPFYGIKYTGVASADNGGFYQDFDTGWAISYKDIAEKYLTNSSFTRFYHDTAQVPWLFDGSTFISYDDPQSIAAKADYIHNRGLGGAMIWQLAQDDSNHTLLNALAEVMD